MAELTEGPQDSKADYPFVEGRLCLILLHGGDLPCVKDMLGALFVSLLDSFNYGVSQDLLLLDAVPKVVEPLFLELELHQGSHLINPGLPLDIPS